MTHYDIIIIGGGSGGLSLSKHAYLLGASVCVFDYVDPSPHGTKWGLGGTCVNVGCIPKKLMHRASILGEDYKMMSDFGWFNTNKLENNWCKLTSKITDYISSLNWSYRSRLKQTGIKYINKKARFFNNNTIEYNTSSGEVKKITADNIVIATGGRPNIPNIEGSELGITSDDIFRLENPPGDTLVIGGSYVGLECGGFLGGLGFKTSIMIRTIPLRGFDNDMAEKIVENMINNKNISIIRDCNPIKLEKKNDKIEVSYQNILNGDITKNKYDTVLFATGRKINTKELLLNTLEYDEKTGKIPVNMNYNTNLENIYAIGDVIQNSLELTPIAVKDGQLLASYLCNRMKDISPISKNVASTVFTPLEYSFVGLSFDKSVELYSKENIEVYHSHFNPLEYELSNLNKNKCYCKIIVHKKTDLILGIHILSPNSSEIILGFSLAMNIGLTKTQLDNTIGVHPTISEELVNLNITVSSGKNAKKEGC